MRGGDELAGRIVRVVRGGSIVGFGDQLPRQIIEKIVVGDGGADRIRIELVYQPPYRIVAVRRTADAMGADQIRESVRLTSLAPSVMDEIDASRIDSATGPSARLEQITGS